MEVLGDIPGRSALIVSAARILVALGYHLPLDSISRLEDIEEIRACNTWCYILDKNMSMLLMRPQNLPKFHTPAASFIPCDTSNSMDMFMQLSLEIARAQESALELIFGTVQNGHNARLMGIEPILRHMETIYSGITGVSLYRYRTFEVRS